MSDPIMISSIDSQIACHTIGGGQPLLGIHGIISDRSFFIDFEEYIPKNCQWITYDRRGYGDSPAPLSGDYSLEVQAEDAAAVLQAMTTGPAWILGHSAGGLVALTLAARHPELVRGITLIETPICYDPELTAAIDGWFAQLTQYRDQGKTKKALPLFSRQIGGTAPASGFDMEKIQRTYRNLDIFLQGELDFLHQDTISLDTLTHLSLPCQVLVTEHGKKTIFGQAVQDTASRLGWPVSCIPGYHNVVQEDAKGFAHSFFPSSLFCQE